jgi:hypothetical protein
LPPPGWWDFSRAIKVDDAIVLMLGGLVAGLVLGTSAPGMDPQIVLFVFLPLIHAAVWFLDQDLRAHARAIGLLVVGSLSPR